MKDKDKIYDWVVYKITSPSGKVYVGKSMAFKTRMENYNCINCTHQIKVHRSLKKHGVKNHKFDIIEEFKSNSLYASGKEIFWIRTYMSNFSKYPEQNGLNLTDGGEGSPGAVWSAEARKRSSESRKGKPNLRSRGRKMTQEFKDKVSKAKKGVPNPKKLGSKHSKETLLKMSKAHEGRVYKSGFKLNLSDEQRNKLRERMLGKPRPGITKSGSHNPLAKKVRCDNLDITWGCNEDAGNALGLSRFTISQICHGHMEHKYGLSLRHV